MHAVLYGCPWQDVLPSLCVPCVSRLVSGGLDHRHICVHATRHTASIDQAERLIGTTRTRWGYPMHEAWRVQEARRMGL